MNSCALEGTRGLLRQRGHCGHQLSELHCDCITSHEAHAGIPVLLHLVEAFRVFSVAVKIPLVADLVAHVAVTGQAYQGLCVDIRNWLLLC